MLHIDSHAHLTSPELTSNIEAVLNRAKEAGVATILSVGTSPVDWSATLALTHRFPGRIRSIVGVHPHEAEHVTEEDLTNLVAAWKDSSVVACGEMGLDYHYDYADRYIQRRIFARQLGLLADNDLPIVIHSREAFDDTLAVLLDHDLAGRRIVFHCFTGNTYEAERIAEHGWRISLTGVVTFRKSVELQSIARDYPSDQLMIETDSPYLSPEPVRSQRPNEPANVAHIARFLAELRGVPFQEFSVQTAENTRRVFGL